MNKKMNKESHIFPLPEVNDIILKLLDGGSFISFCLTCKSTYVRGNDRELWNNIIRKEKIYYEDKHMNSLEEWSKYYKYRYYNKYNTDYVKIKNAIQIKNDIIIRQKNNDTLNYHYLLINVYDTSLYQTIYHIIDEYYAENGIFGYYDEFMFKYNEKEYYLFFNYGNSGFSAESFMREDEAKQVDNRIKMSKFLFELILTFIIIDDNYDGILNHDYDLLI